MKISILDDDDDTLRTLYRLARLKGHGVEVCNDHVQHVDALAQRFRETEALVLIRERTEIRAPLLRRLPKLPLISQRGVYPSNRALRRLLAEVSALNRQPPRPRSTGDVAAGKSR
jgi:D-3-phosphoglycerate dehydrogenase